MLIMLKLRIRTIRLTTTVTCDAHGTQFQTLTVNTTRAFDEEQVSSSTFLESQMRLRLPNCSLQPNNNSTWLHAQSPDTRVIKGNVSPVHLDGGGRGAFYERILFVRIFTCGHNILDIPGITTQAEMSNSAVTTVCG